ncbi:hypothetical protein DS745_12345 [Anaerobacillus alkaliphilus]|uniref:FAD/NAD(P)-binding domain-containing protein n=1 Tax=Anaerobacillus alkaliphilus TaxID=1548597 RepID=A0A4Q0VTL3_9BACI|nr:FAD/NAD(P)-binding protein [Anaerobacillus alkaliphilus]RXJ00315.1 hypothetical protein DS745_12345 [Anaerobacillus alkaliphilus]
MKKWVIIGGGIQGCTMASYLRQSLHIKAHDLNIIDPKEKPLSNWRSFTKTIGMSYLRSPSIHHIDPSPFALEKYAKQHRNQGFVKFYAPYDRPDLHLFNQHCDEVLEQINIDKCWVQGRVKALKKFREGWIVTLENNVEIKAVNVVIAIGLSDQLRWPEWAREGKKEGSNIVHVFDDKEEIAVRSSIVIVGAGISAAHAAIKWSNLLPENVTILTRHPLKVHQFDSDPGWLGPKYMSRFHQIHCYEERRKVIKAARFSGSLPVELKTEIERRKKSGILDVKIDEVMDVSDELLTLKSGEVLSADAILLATGFEQKPPGMEWLQELIQTYCLPCASCGYPIPKQSLEWDEGLYLLGALAELQLGPVARNISGARRGAERIISSF